MLWLIYSLLSAVFHSTSDLFSKKGLQDLDEYVVAFSRNFFSTVSLLPLLIFIGIPFLDDVFWWVVIGNGLLVSVTFILYMKAIKLSPLSLTIPMIAFTPLFLLVTSPLILGEFPSMFGMIGIFLIVLGVYILSVRDVRKGFLAPFKVLTREKGVLIMLLVAFLWSIAANLFKVGTQHSNPIVYLVVGGAFVSGILFLVTLIKTKNPLKMVSENLKFLFPAGFFEALLNVFSLSAMELTIVAYTNSARRTSILFSVLYGHFFFHEKRILERLSGALIMVVGIVLISFA